MSKLSGLLLRKPEIEQLQNSVTWTHTYPSSLPWWLMAEKRGGVRSACELSRAKSLRMHSPARTPSYFCVGCSIHTCRRAFHTCLTSVSPLFSPCSTTSTFRSTQRPGEREMLGMRNQSVKYTDLQS